MSPSPLLSLSYHSTPYPDIDPSTLFSHSPSPPSFPPPPHGGWEHARAPSPSAASTSSGSSSRSSASPYHDDPSYPNPSPPRTSSSSTPSFPSPSHPMPTASPSPSSTSSSHPPTSVPPPAKAKRKRGAITPQQRAELKRMKHREIDAQRRQRENSVVSRLHELNAWKGVRKESSVEIGVEGEEEEDDYDSKQDKVSILEQSAAKLAELQDLVTQLSRTCESQQENMHKLSLHLREVGSRLTAGDDEQLLGRSGASSSVLSLLPQSTSDFLQSYDRSHVLHSSVLTQASLCIFLVAVDSGRVLEANDATYISTGWRPEHILNRVMTAPYDVFMDTTRMLPGEMTPPPPQNPHRLLVEGPDGQLVPARTYSQYQRSKKLMIDLYMGRKQCITAVWRTQLRDGHAVSRRAQHTHRTPHHLSHPSPLSLTTSSS